MTDRDNRFDWYDEDQRVDARIKITHAFVVTNDYVYKQTSKEIIDALT
jgi:hypothetical protein